MNINYQKIINDFNLFFDQYDSTLKERYWQGKRDIFYDFWVRKIKNKEYKLLVEDTNEIVRIIDVNARGQKGEREAIAKTNIYQNHWEKAFKDLKNNLELQLAFDKILYANSDDNLAEMIDDLLLINKNNRNGINGPEMIMINCFLFLKDYNRFLSIISLHHRRLIIEKFNIAEWPTNLSIGQQVVWSNNVINDKFHEIIKLPFTSRAISEFLYLPHGNYVKLEIKNLWYEKKIKNVKSDIVFSELKLKPFARDERLFVKPKNDKEFKKGFLEIQKINYENGKLGEKFVIKNERERLIREGRADLSSLIEDKSDTNGGYDVLSRNADGSYRYIEVKSTERKKSSSFFITRNEIEASEKYGDNYYLYVVTDVKNNPRIKFYKKPDFFHNKCFEMVPINYVAMYEQE